MDALQRFFDYISYETTSDEFSGTTPSSPKELFLADHIVGDLHSIGVEDAWRDDYGYVYARIPATPGQERVTPMGLIAHMDTSPDAPGANIHPRVVRYMGGDIILDPEKNTIMSPKDFPSLDAYIDQEIVVTDGTTLLGSDDKAGVTEIVTLAERLVLHPEIPHGELWLAFTPDEEIGEGADHFDLRRFKAKYAYTVDGGGLGELEYENFNAASVQILFHGRGIHPGEAKNKMINAALMACQFVSMMPAEQAPAHTEGYEGFYHINHISGDETEAEIRMLVRDHDRASFEQRKKYLVALAKPMWMRYGEDRIEIKIKHSYYNMKEIIKLHMDLIDKAEKAFRAVDVQPKIVPIRGGTDGARLSFMGLPCPNLSTGGHNFHGVYEYLPVDSLYKMVDVLTELVRTDK